MKYSIVPCILLAVSLYPQDIGFSRVIGVQEDRIHGPDVLAVQSRLSDLGYMVKAEADGWFGPLTESAVKDFQSDYEIQSTGIIDRGLWDFLFYDELERIKNILFIKNSIDSSMDLSSELAFDYEKHYENGPGFPIGYSVRVYREGEEIKKLIVRQVGDGNGYSYYSYYSRGAITYLYTEMWVYDFDEKRELRYPGDTFFMVNQRFFARMRQGEPISILDHDNIKEAELRSIDNVYAVTKEAFARAKKLVSE